MKTPCAADDAGVVPLRDVGTRPAGEEEGVAPDSGPCGDPMHLANLVDNPVDNPVDCVPRTEEALFPTLRTNYWNNGDAVAESKMLVLGEVAPIPIQESGRRTGRSTDDLRVGLGVGQPGDPMYTLQTDSRHAVMTLDEGIVAFDAKRDGSLQASTPVPVEDAGACGGSAAGDRESVVLAFQTSQSDVRLSETHATLDAHNGSRRWNGVLTIDASGGPGQPGEPMRPESVPAGVTIPFDLAQITSKGNRSRADIRSTSPSINASGQLHVAHALTSHAGRNEVDGNYICVTGDTAHALTHDGADASEDGTGRGTPIIARMVAIGEYIEDTQASTLKARDAKDATDLVCQTVHVVNGDETPKVARDLVPALRADQGSGARHAICGTPLPPRRITPRECERLMGLPDDWTLLPNASDAARYRGCGNAEVTYVVQWIGERLRRAWHGITQP